MISWDVIPSCRAVGQGPADAAARTVSNGTPRAVWVCGSKKISTCRTPWRARTGQVGGGQVVEVPFVDEHRAPA